MSELNPLTAKNRLLNSSIKSTVLDSASLNRSPESNSASKNCRLSILNFYNNNYSHPTHLINHHALKNDLSNLIYAFSKVRQEVYHQPISVAKTCATLILQIKQLIICNVNQTGLNQKDCDQLLQALETIAVRESQFRQQYTIDPASFTRPNWLEENSYACDQYIDMVALTCETVYSSLIHSQNPEAAQCSFTRSILDSIGLEVEASALGISESDFKMESNNEMAGILAIRHNYVMFKMMERIHDNQHKGAGIQENSIISGCIGDIKLYIRSCEELYHETTSCSRSESDLDVIKKNVASIYGRMNDSNIKFNDLTDTVFDYMYAAMELEDPVAKSFYDNMGKDLDKIGDLISVETLVDQAIILNESIKNFQKESHLKDDTKASITSLHKKSEAHKQTLINLIEEQEDYTTFSEAFYWIFSQDKCLEKLMTQFNTLESEYKQIIEFEKKALTDDQLFELFDSPAVTSKKESSKGKKKSASRGKNKTRVNQKKTSGSGQLASTKRAENHITPHISHSVTNEVLSSATVLSSPSVININSKMSGIGDPGDWHFPFSGIQKIQPELALSQVSNNRYNTTAAFVAHTGEKSTPLISSNPKLNLKSLERLANKHWSSRIIHGQLYPPIHNMLFHYNKHCCKGVKKEAIITIEDYCLLVKKAYATTTKEIQFHKDNLTETRMTASTSPLYGAYTSNNTDKIQCHTLYQRDPKQPKKTMPFTLTCLQTYLSQPALATRNV